MNKLFIIIGCVVLSLALGFILVWPKYQALQVLQADAAVKEKELQSKQEYFSQIKEISKELESYTDSLDKISSALPQNPALPDLFNLLQISANQTGLILEKIILGSVDKGEILVTLQLAGNYPALKSFLLVLEKSARMIEAQEISFEAPQKTGEPFKFVLQIKSQFY